MTDPSDFAGWLAGIGAILLVAALIVFGLALRRTQKAEAEQAARTYSELIFLSVHSTMLACREYQPDSLRRENAMLEELGGLPPQVLASPLVPAHVRSSLLQLRAASCEMHVLVASTQLKSASIEDKLAEIEQLYANCRFQYGHLMEYFFDMKADSPGL